jgi:WD40 repeat protein
VVKTEPDPSGTRATPVVIPNGTLMMIQQQEVPSEREGRLIFIGTEVKAGEKVPADKQIKPDPTFYFLAVECNPGEEGAFEHPRQPLRWYKPWHDPMPLLPEKVQVFRVQRHVRKLEVGEEVKKEQLVAFVNPAVAYSELNVQVAELGAAEAERQAAVRLRDSARERYQNYKNAPPGTISRDEMLKAQSEYDKAVYDAEVKKSAISSAQAKLQKAALTLQLYEIRSAVPGVIKHIYKNHEGDAVKPNDPIIQVQNPKLLRVECLFDVQEAMKLSPGMEAVVEATRPDPPQAVLSGHLDAVTCVAVGQGAGDKPVIVSGSDDGTVRGWDLATGANLWRLEAMSAAPRALACTGLAAGRSLLLVGDKAGIGFLYDLKDVGKKPLELKPRHQGAITCAAFSADGKLCATAGEDDRAVRLWDTSTGKELYLIQPAHRAAVTSLQFAGNHRLVSAGRDNTLAIWTVAADTPPQEFNRFRGRSDAVAQLGVSPDGKHVLVDQDQGRELRVLSVEPWGLQASLDNPQGSLPFSTFALYSPDGKTILTNGPAAGRLQLWRAPAEQQPRASELREFVWSKGVATCGAFSPDGNTVVTGTQDHQVLVWAMPSKEELSTPLRARLSYVERALDTRARQVRVWAELTTEKPDWLVPGGTATLVVDPGKGPPAPLPVK